MSKLRRQQSANTSNVVETKSLTDIKSKTGNLYESIAVIAKRANQINISLKEQIEISKAYERMPNPALLASTEFMEDKVYYRKNEDDLFS